MPDQPQAIGNLHGADALVDELAPLLARGIGADGRTTRPDDRCLPDPHRVDRLYDLFVDFAFPGFISWKPLGDHRTLLAATRSRLEETGLILVEQICRAGENKNPDWARDAASSMLRQIGPIRQSVSLDVQAAFDGDPACHSPDEAILCMPGVRAITIYRFAHAMLRLGVPLLPRMLAARAQRETGVDIHPGARIGRSFFIDHGEGVVVGETTHIGDHCKLYQGVTLGAKSLRMDERGRIAREPKRHPTLEDHVTVYANATILGGDTVIGAGSVIGGGVFLMESVPAGRMVLGPKPEARIRENRERPPISFDI